MVLLSFLFFGWGGYYFSDATVYDENLNSLREGRHILVDDRGLVELVADRPISVADNVATIAGALILPHPVDFYCLIQDRGLGFDEDIDTEIQSRIARYLKAAGMDAIRDPVFPAKGLFEGFPPVTVYAQGGYLALRGGPGAAFGLVVDPGDDPNQWKVPRRGPISLWWTGAGDEQRLTWAQHPEFVRSLINFFHARNQKVGCYIQDASPTEMEALFPFPFDFYEGIPGEGVDMKKFPEIVWVPIASLNDKRYCAVNLRTRLAQAGKLGLFGPLDMSLSEERLDQAMMRLRERCSIWQKRRDQALAMVRQWIAAKGRIGIGAGGGHLFSLTGDIKTELQTLDELGASQPQLLEALFETTPALLGTQRPYLKRGKPAHFIVYKTGGYWGGRIGDRVDLNFMDGGLVE